MLLHGHAHRGAAGWRGAVSPGVVLAGTLPEPGVAGRHRSSSVAPFARWEGLPHAWRCAQDARTCWGHQGATETALSFGLRQFGSQRIPLYPHTIEDYVSCHTVLYPTLPYLTLPYPILSPIYFSSLLPLPALIALLFFFSPHCQ